MYTSNTFQAEIDYRTKRISSTASKPRTHHRVPFVRRPAETSDLTR